MVYVKADTLNLATIFQIPRAVKGSVQFLLDKKNERNNQEEICDVLDLNQVQICRLFWFSKLVTGNNFRVIFFNKPKWGK